jgi:membrane protease YdiL (CAAX protease family)
MSQENGCSPGFDPPRLLIREAVGICLVLMAALAASKADQQLFFTWQGWPSSLLLIVLCAVFQRYFHAPVVWFRGKTAGKRIPFCIVLSLAALFLISSMPFPVIVSFRLSFAVLDSFAQQCHLLLLVPISEELFFRGILLNHLKRGFGAVRAAILCSVLFAVLHIPQGSAMEALVLSVFACLLVLHSGMLVYAVQLHIAWNSFVIARQVPFFDGGFLVMVAVLAILISSFLIRKTQSSYAPA